jgi:hypothetical protein
VKNRKVKLVQYALRGWFADELLFVTIESAAEMLDVHVKYVPELIKQGHLAVIELTDTKGRLLARGVTEDSIRAYRTRQPARRKKQLDLLPDLT